MHALARIAKLGAVVALLLTPWACGPRKETRGEIFERYRARIEAMWESAGAAYLRKDEPIKVGAVAGQPRPFANSNLGRARDTNVAIVPADLLLKGEAPKIDLSFGSPLMTAHAMAFDSDTLRARQAADEDFELMLQAAVETPYVGAYVVQSYTPPELLANGTYTAGAIDMMVGVMDVANRTLIATCTVWAKNDEAVNVPGLLQGDEFALGRVESQLAKNVRAETAKCLAEQTKGEFNFY